MAGADQAGKLAAKTEQYEDKRLKLFSAVKSNNVQEARRLYQDLWDLRPEAFPGDRGADRIFNPLVEAAMGVVRWESADENAAIKEVLKMTSDLSGSDGPCRLLSKDTSQKGCDPRTAFLDLADRVELTDYAQRAIMALLMLLREEERGQVIAPFGQKERQQTALYMSAWAGRSWLLEQMIQCLPEKDRSTLLARRDGTGCTALHVAVRREQFDATKKILHVCDRNLLFMEDDAHHTALHMAMTCSNPDIAIDVLDSMNKPKPLQMDFLDGVFTYALELNMAESIQRVAEARPDLFSEEVVRMAFRRTNAIGELIARALAPPLEVYTETVTLWLPLLALGSDPVVKQVNCREPKHFETRKVTKTGWTSNTEVRLVIPLEEQTRVESSVVGCCGGLNRVRCEAHKLPRHLLKSTEVVRGLTDASGASLRTPLAHGVLAKWWAKFEPYYHLDIFLNFCHLLLAALLTFASRNGHTEEAWFYLCLALLSVLVLKDSLDEALQLRMKDSWVHGCSTLQFTDHVLQFMDYTRVVVEVFALSLLYLQPSGEPASVFTKTVTAGWVWIWWSHSLFDLRGLRSVGPRLMPIFSAVSSVRVQSFFLLVFFVLAASTHAYYVLAVRGEPSHIYAAILHMYRLGVLGDFDMFELEGQDPTLEAAGEGVWEPVDPEMSSEYVWVHILFYFVTMLVTVVLMNLFIGVLGGSYDQSLDMAEELFMSTRARLVLEYEAGLLPWLVKLFAKIPWLVKPFAKKSDGSQQPQAVEGACAELSFEAVFTRAEEESADQSMREFVRKQIERSEQTMHDFVSSQFAKSLEKMEEMAKVLGPDAAQGDDLPITAELRAIKKLLEEKGNKPDVR